MIGDGKTKQDSGCKRGFNPQPLRLNITDVSIARGMVTTMISKIIGSSLFFFLFIAMSSMS